MKAVIYARVSTEEQKKGYSLQTQVEACRQYAVAHGYTVACEFQEDYTGASLDRPALNQLRAFVAAHSIGVVIVYDVDRLARKSVYQMIIEEELNRHRTRVEYVNGDYADTDEGRLQKQIRASIAEYEKAKILERGKRGKRGKAQSGFVVVGARPPYGGRVKSEPHKAWFEIDEDEAQIVRLVYQWYTRGDPIGHRISLRAIAKKLAAMRVPTRGDKQSHFAKKNGACVWTEAMIRHILSAETYTGVWHYGKTQMISDGKEATRKAVPKRGFGKQVARPSEEWIAVRVPQIIDHEVWLRAKKRLAENKREINGRPNTRRFLLAKRLSFAKCGYKVHCQRVRQKYHYYVCNGRQQIVSKCDMPSIRADLVDDCVWNWIKTLLEQPEKVSEGLRAEQEEADRANNALRERISIIEAGLADSQSQLGKLIDLYLRGDFPQGMLTGRKTRLEKDVADLEYERRELSAHLERNVLTDEQVMEIEAFCAEVQQGLTDATFEDKQRYFELLDVRAKLAIEKDERIIYAQCKLGKQQLSDVQTSRLSNTGAITTRGCGCP